MEPQNGVRHLEGVIQLSRHDAGIGGHSRKQFQVGVRNGDDHVVGNHVLRDDGRLADIADLPSEGSARIRVHRECSGLAYVDVADIRLVHAGIKLHLRQVLRDLEDRRSGKRSGYGLAYIHAAGDDGTIHRSGDLGMGEVDLVLSEYGLRLALLCLLGD